MPASSRRFPLREKQSGRRSRCARHCLKVFSPPACRAGYQTLQVGSTMQFLPWKYPTPSSVAPARNRNVCSGAAGRRAAPPRGCACASSLPYSHSCRLTSTFSGVLPSLVFLSPGQLGSALWGGDVTSVPEVPAGLGRVCAQLPALSSFPHVSRGFGQQLGFPPVLHTEIGS